MGVTRASRGVCHPFPTPWLAPLSLGPLTLSASVYSSGQHLSS